MVRWMMNHGNAGFLDTFDNPMLGILPYVCPLLAFVRLVKRDK